MQHERQDHDHAWQQRLLDEQRLEQQRQQQLQEQERLEQEERLDWAQAQARTQRQPDAPAAEPGWLGRLFARPPKDERAPRMSPAQAADQPLTAIQGGAFGDKLIAALILLCVLGAAFWFFRPATPQPQLPRLESAPPMAATAQTPDSGKAEGMSSAVSDAPETPEAHAAQLQPEAMQGSELPGTATAAPEAVAAVEWQQALLRLEDAHADVQALAQRVAALESGLEHANAQAQSLSAALSLALQAKDETGKSSESKSATVPAASARRGKPAAKAKAVARKPDAQPQGELLAVDLWNGQPSAIVGTGVAGDERIRVMQPGDQINGIGLLAADVRQGRATFSTRQGGQFTLSVMDERPMP